MPSAASSSWINRLRGRFIVLDGPDGSGKSTQFRRLADHCRGAGLAVTEVTSEQVGRAVLERLRELDVIAAVRFASVYKGFDDLADFERELSLLTKLTKRTAPKAH